MRTLAMAAAFVAVAFPVYALELPSEVTPAIRAACEKDVRRLCIRSDSTFASVKECVRRKFARLNTTCKLRLVRAGF